MSGRALEARMIRNTLSWQSAGYQQL